MKQYKLVSNCKSTTFIYIFQYVPGLLMMTSPQTLQTPGFPFLFILPLGSGNEFVCVCVCVCWKVGRWEMTIVAKFGQKN